MLLDPIVFNYGFTAGAPTGGTPSNFRRTQIGKYVSVDGSFSSDQPARLSILPNVKLQGPSTYKFRAELDKNVSPINGIQQSDDTLRIDSNIYGNLRSFSATDIVNLHNLINGIIAANMLRIISGES